MNADTISYMFKYDGDESVRDLVKKLLGYFKVPFDDYKDNVLIDSTGTYGVIETKAKDYRKLTKFRYKILAKLLTNLCGFKWHSKEERLNSDTNELENILIFYNYND